MNNKEKCFFNAAIAFTVVLALVLPGSAIFANIGRPIENEINEITDIDGIVEPSDEIDWWPMYRHDLRHSGYSTGTAPDNSNLLWNYTIGGTSSSPAVADGKVFIGSYDDNVYCLDTEDGNKLWNYTTDGWVYSSPAVADGKVFFGSVDKNVYCLYASNGTVDWKYTTGGEVWSSPAVADGKVFFGSLDENVYCLNASNGTVDWKYTTGDRVFSTPAVADGKVFIGSEVNTIHCINASTGIKIWKYTTTGPVYSSPAIADGKVYVGSYDGNVYCLYTSNGSVAWKYPTGDMVGSSPAVADGKVFIGSRGGSLYCLYASNGTVDWEYPTGNLVYSSPAVADGKVFIGSYDDNVYCLDTEDGNKLWNYTTDGDLYSSPAVADGKVFIGSHDGELYCFGPFSGHDVGVRSIDSPVSGHVGVFTPEVTVTNYGTYNETNVPVNMQITKIGNLDPEYNETVYIDIDSKETKIVTFPEWIPDDIPTFGSIDYEVTACTQLEGDERPLNDCKTVIITLMYLHDVGVENITSLGDLPPGEYPVEGIVKNYGIYTETNFNVNATIWTIEDRDTMFYTDDFIVATIDPFDTVTAIFENVIFLDADVGDYRLEMTTELAGDDVPENDQKVLLFTIAIPDTWPPVTTHNFTGIVGNNEWYKSNVMVTLTAEDTAPPYSVPSGVEFIYYKIDSGGWETYWAPFVVSDDGEHTLYYYSVDFAGNRENTSDADFNIDQTQPTINLTWNKEDSKLVADVFDETSGVAKVEFYVNGGYVGTVTTSPYEWEVTRPRKGDKGQAIVYDNAGNSKVSPKIDATPQSQSQSSGSTLVPLYLWCENKNLNYMGVTPHISLFLERS